MRCHSAADIYESVFRYPSMEMWKFSSQGITKILSLVHGYAVFPVSSGKELHIKPSVEFLVVYLAKVLPQPP